MGTYDDVNVLYTPPATVFSRVGAQGQSWAETNGRSYWGEKVRK